MFIHRETDLFYDQNKNSDLSQQLIAKTVSHELAHTLFGSMVTVEWWNDIWLNEGFATYAAYIGLDYAENRFSMVNSF